MTRMLFVTIVAGLLQACVAAQLVGGVTAADIMNQDHMSDGESSEGTPAGSVLSGVTTANVGAVVATSAVPVAEGPPSGGCESDDEVRGVATVGVEPVAGVCGVTTASFMSGTGECDGRFRAFGREGRFGCGGRIRTGECDGRFRTGECYGRFRGFAREGRFGFHGGPGAHFAR